MQIIGIYRSMRRCYYVRLPLKSVCRLQVSCGGLIPEMTTGGAHLCSVSISFHLQWSYSHMYVICHISGNGICGRSNVHRSVAENGCFGAADIPLYLGSVLFKSRFPVKVLRLCLLYTSRCV